MYNVCHHASKITLKSWIFKNIAVHKLMLCYFITGLQEPAGLRSSRDGLVQWKEVCQYKNLYNVWISLCIPDGQVVQGLFIRGLYWFEQINTDHSSFSNVINPIFFLM